MYICIYRYIDIIQINTYLQTHIHTVMDRSPSSHMMHTSNDNTYTYAHTYIHTRYVYTKNIRSMYHGILIYAWRYICRICLWMVFILSWLRYKHPTNQPTKAQKTNTLCTWPPSRWPLKRLEETPKRKASAKYPSNKSKKLRPISTRAHKTHRTQTQIHARISISPARSLADSGDRRWAQSGPPSRPQRTCADDQQDAPATKEWATVRGKRRGWSGRKRKAR